MIGVVSRSAGSALSPDDLWVCAINGRLPGAIRNMHKLMRGQKRAILKRMKAQCVEIRHLVEQAAANLPERFRTVFVLRMIEDMSVEETANLLCLQP
jgi:hypothetical protein